MAKDIHTLEVMPGSDSFGSEDRIQILAKFQLATAAGASAGASVSTAIANLTLPAKYAVLVTPNQDAVPYVTTRSQTGFTVVLNPRLAANTLAAGTVDVLVVA